ncbi:MAG: hypothetical protein JNL73_10790 [Anaerolineales bacterium]|nr:hypothetical protein [Anaerolineales bacterium]
MSGLLEYALAVALLAVFLSAFSVATSGLLRTRTRRIAEVLDRHARRAIWVGALNLGFGVAMALPFFALQGATGGEAWAFPGLMILVGLLILVGIGFAGLSQWVGARLAAESSPARRILLGSLSLTLGAGLPLAGTFFILPLMLALSLGALILSFLVRPPVQDPPPA